MVDFANSKIGGGVLSNGCVQEEILFSIFPECIIAKVLTEKLDDDEAIVISGARRFSTYEGYSYKFKFNGGYHQKEVVPNSVIVAIDAFDFNSVPSKNWQY
eukprot:GHVR01193221.1.p1 GENE.GHVR01193221.1~~GHVR01193221.1.p1  ORF type:complete len:101 (-),score=11.66 GHVR01193221.1:448-750(-)